MKVASQQFGTKKFTKLVVFIALFFCQILLAQPPINNPTNYNVCDDNNDGYSIFNLTSKNAEILGSLSPVDYTVSYHLTVVDAQIGANSLPNSYANSTPYNETVYVRVQENANPSNFATTILSLGVIEISLNYPSDLVIFETPYDGVSLFNLTNVNSSITSYPEFFDFTYYNSLADALNDQNSILNPSEYQGTNNQMIYIRATSIDENHCYGIVSLKIVVLDENNRPQVNTLTNVYLCEQNNTTSGYYNIVEKNVEVLSNLDENLYSVKYYFNQDEANNNSPNDIVTLGYTSFSSVDIFVRVYENSNHNNFSITSFAIEVFTMPIANAVSNYVVYEGSYDGISTFDLTSNSTQIIGSQSNMSVKYYTSESDAIIDSNPIALPVSYTNLYNQQNIWVRVFNNENLLCFTPTSITTFKLIVVDLDDIINIPDINFKNGLLNTGLDINSDGNIQRYEALQLTEFYYFNQTARISSLEGIQSFINLTRLECPDNYITTVDLSNLHQLKYLFLQLNENLTTLNINGLTNIEVIDMSQTHLNSIDVSNLVNLKRLTISGGTFTSLNLSNNNLLWDLRCSSNQLNNLDLTNLTNLQILWCDNNNLSSLVLPSNVNLSFLLCNNNQLTNLDLSAINSLEVLECYNNLLSNLDVSHFNNLIRCRANDNNLQQVFLKNGYNYSVPNAVASITDSYNFSNNPNLNYACVDDSKVNQWINYFAINSMPNVNVNSYCTFLPGGIYNTITGNVRFDINSNGCDLLDETVKNLRLNMNQDGVYTSTFSDLQGNYNFYTISSAQFVEPYLENPSYFNVTPNTSSITFTNNNNNVYNQDFCISSNGIHNDLEVVIQPITVARPGFDAVYKLVYKNKGNQFVSGNIQFDFDNSVLNFITATQMPDVQSTNQLTWNYNNLNPLETRSLFITLTVNSPTSSQPVSIGDVLNYAATISSSLTDEIPLDNYFALSQTVVGSYDPNIITCLEGNNLPVSEIGNYLHYVVDFENTGNFPAENVVVKMQIDELHYDINTLQVLDASHNSYVRIRGNIAEFIFQQLNLDTGGHGNVLLKIKSKNTLQAGDMVSKRADIYFDYNAPVDTGFANTVYQSLSATVVSIDNSVLLYPNPTNAIVNIKANTIIKSIELYDFQGRLLQKQSLKNTHTIIDVSQRSKGIYFLKIISEAGSKVEKIIKE